MTNISDLANEIARQVELYTRDVAEKVDDIQVEVAKNAVSELKSKSPKLSGKYSKGWRVKKVGNNVVVHNTTNYQLTHLLEFGHAKKNGGRVPGKPHIRPVEQTAIQEFTTKIEGAIRG